MFEVTLVISVIVAWSQPEVRNWLLTGLASHALMRIGSAFDFIPKALEFERAEPTSISEAAARRWTSRSMLRLSLDVVTCLAMFAAFTAVVQWTDR
jgi:hypothetical protein